MPFMTLNSGDKLYYEVNGPEEGAPVMLLHGWCASMRLYSEQIPALNGAGYRTIALDSIGHGRSGKKVGAVDKDVVVERFFEVAERVGLCGRPFALIGHSAGGGVAQQIYLKRPDKIACLVLLNTGYLMRDSLLRKIFWTFSPQMVEALFNPVTKLALRPAVNAAADAAGLAFNKNPHDVRLWMADVFRTRPGTARKEIEEIMRHSTKDDLPGIKCPTLIIGGSFDPLAPARQSRVMHDLIPNSELHIVPTGHVGKMLRSELYNPFILDFLARHYPPSQTLRGRVPKPRKPGTKKSKDI
jgi:pimeloyl-ACP methyl ester carboxylesterase